MQKATTFPGCRLLVGSVLAFALFLMAELFVYPLYSQQSSGEFSSARVQEIAGMLTEQPSGFGSPCSDRAAWSARAVELSSFVEEAQQIIKIPILAFDENAYLQYTRKGDRRPMEQNLRARMSQLAPLVLAECAEDKGVYLQRIADLMDNLAASPSWTLSAHDPMLLNLHGERYYVDLNAADMADNLAEAIYLLGDELPVMTRKHVTSEMERHVFGPMRRSLSAGDSASNDDSKHNGNWWLYADMNWNAVCLKGVTGAALAVLPSINDRALFAAAAEHFIQNYDDGFNPDGYDTEGLGYWNYGFSHFIELRENLLRVTGGNIDILTQPKMQKVALFGVNFPMLPDNAAAFGDAGLKPKADQHQVRMIDHIFQVSSTDPKVEEQSSGIQHAELTSSVLDLFPISGDELPTPLEAKHHELQTYYADSGVLVSRPAPSQGLAVTIKAGGNTTHSHNDIGSFAIGLGDVQPIGDPGGPGYYTAETFGPHRLNSELLNSFGHPVPEIDGHLQLDATKVKVNVLSHSSSPRQDRIVIDMTSAYEVAKLKRLTRTMVHSRDGDGMVEITDEFHLTRPAVVIESLPTHGTWSKIDSHTLLFTVGGKQLRVTIHAQKPMTFTETKVDDYGNAFTRVAVRLEVGNLSKIIMRFTPKER